MEQIGEALYTSAGMLWKTLWALSFGYTISAAIQVVVTREQMGRMLGERGPKEGRWPACSGSSRHHVPSRRSPPRASRSRSG